jgi:hypothetical protein
VENNEEEDHRNEPCPEAEHARKDESETSRDRGIESKRNNEN